MNGALPLMWRKIPERYNLVGVRCETCSTEYFPQRRVCPKCRRRGKLVEKQMPAEGKIYSFSEVSSGPRGFEHETPYWLALVELPNQVRILSQIVDSDEKDMKIGAPVKMVFRKLAEDGEEGIISYGYKFRVVK